MLAGIHPKDFDIATSALPNEVKRKVSGSYIIGKRFRLVLVKRGETQFEVATFRRNVRIEDVPADSDVTGDNYFGTCEEDSQRRDFTINALFYDPVNHKMLDYVDGQKDVELQLIRMIGDPKERFIEDPIRLLRALRLSHKLRFRLEPSLRAAMIETAPELLKAVLPRRREEYLKILRLKEPGRAWAEMHDLGMLEIILPGLNDLYKDHQKALVFEEMLMRIGWTGIDLGSPLELFSAFLYSFLRAKHPDNELTAAEIETNPRWNAFMKDEVGLFKVEAAVFLKALELIPSLKEIDTYKKKGVRRKLGFLRNDTLPLALKLSQIDGELDYSEFEFWLEEIRHHAQAIWS